MTDENKTAAPEEAILTLADIRRAIEAILFAAGYPVSYIRLADVLTLTEKEVKDTVKEYAQKYNKEGIARGVQLIM